MNDLEKTIVYGTFTLFISGVLFILFDFFNAEHPFAAVASDVGFMVITAALLIWGVTLLLVV
jgi:hypothetical protein